MGPRLHYNSTMTESTYIDSAQILEIIYVYFLYIFYI